jgi:hypothetical protein
MFMIATTIWIWINWIIAWRRGYFFIFQWSVETWAFRALVCVFSLWLLLVLVLIGALLILHSFLIVTKQTTGEFIRGRRKNKEMLSRNSSATSVQQFAKGKLPELVDNEEFEEIVANTREEDRLQEVSPLTSPPIAEHTTALETNSWLHRLAYISSDIISWFSTLQLITFASVLQRNNSNSKNSRHYCSEVNEDELPRHLDTNLELGEGKNEEIDHMSTTTVSSLSFKSASYQSLSTHPNSCNMGASVMWCFTCGNNRKDSKTIRKERLRDCNLRKFCRSASSEIINEVTVFAGAENSAALVNPTRLLPMWQYVDSEDEDLQRQLIDQILSTLRRFQQESAVQENRMHMPTPQNRNHNPSSFMVSSSLDRKRTFNEEQKQQYSADWPMSWQSPARLRMHHRRWTAPGRGQDSFSSSSTKSNEGL